MTQAISYEKCPWIEEWDDRLCEFVYEACNNWSAKYFNDKKKILKTYETYKWIVEWDDRISVTDIPDSDWDIVTDAFKDYPNDSPFKVTQKVYKVNMTNIYSCALDALKLQELNTMIDDLVKDPSVSKLFTKKLEWYRTSIKKKLPTSCGYKEWEKVDKKLILQETTYEMCKYVSTLKHLEFEYMSRPIMQDVIPQPERVTYSDWNRSTELDSWPVSDYDMAQRPRRVSQMPMDETDRKNVTLTQFTSLIELTERISREVTHTKEVYDTAFTAFVEYENNYVTHLYLELLKADLKAYRNALHNTLIPLNQLPTKIVWAMSY